MVLAMKLHKLLKEAKNVHQLPPKLDIVQPCMTNILVLLMLAPPYNLKVSLNSLDVFSFFAQKQLQGIGSSEVVVSTAHFVSRNQNSCISVCSF